MQLPGVAPCRSDSTLSKTSRSFVEQNLESAWSQIAADAAQRQTVGSIRSSCAAGRQLLCSVPETDGLGPRPCD